MSFEHSRGMPLISACTWYDSRTAKSPRPLSLEDEGCICLIRLSWYHHHLPRAGASVGSFLTWSEGQDRRTITGASRSRLVHLNKWWFTGWLEGVIEKGRRQYFQQLYCSLKTPGSLSTCPCRCLIWCSPCDYSMACLRSQIIPYGPALKKSYPDLPFLTSLNWIWYSPDISNALCIYQPQYDALLMEARDSLIPSQARCSF